MKLHFLTFASTNMSNKRITKEVKSSKVFDSVTSLTEKDLPKEYQKELKNRIAKYGMRGYAYWSWKPYIIKSTLSKIDDDDFLLYMDAGSTFNANKKSLDVFYSCIENMKTLPLQITGLKTSSTDINYTTKEIIDFMSNYYNYSYTADELGERQICAGTILLIKNEDSVKAVDEFNDVCNNHFELITDVFNKKQKEPTFIDNRHDQSVWSLITKYYKIVPSNIGGGSYNENCPIWHTRKRYN